MACPMCGRPRFPFTSAFASVFFLSTAPSPISPRTPDSPSPPFRPSLSGKCSFSDVTAYVIFSICSCVFLSLCVFVGFMPLPAWRCLFLYEQNGRVMKDPNHQWFDSKYVQHTLGGLDCFPSYMQVGEGKSVAPDIAFFCHFLSFFFASRTHIK